MANKLNHNDGILSNCTKTGIIAPKATIIAPKTE